MSSFYNSYRDMVEHVDFCNKQRSSRVFVADSTLLGGLCQKQDPPSLSRTISYLNDSEVAELIKKIDIK